MKSSRLGVAQRIERASEPDAAECAQAQPGFEVPDLHVVQFEPHSVVDLVVVEAHVVLVDSVPPATRRREENKRASSVSTTAAPRRSRALHAPCIASFSLLPHPTDF